ncbi:MAG TPA: hypothetical protein VF482_13610 [Trebonia sp.]
MKPFWRADDDAAVARYLAEHGAVSRMDGDELVIEARQRGTAPTVAAGTRDGDLRCLRHPCRSAR